MVFEIVKFVVIVGVVVIVEVVIVVIRSFFMGCFFIVV